MVEANRAVDVVTAPMALDPWFLGEAERAARGAFEAPAEGPLFLYYRAGALRFAAGPIDGFAVCDADESGNLIGPESLPLVLSIEGAIAWTIARAGWLPCLKCCSKCRLWIADPQLVGDELCERCGGL